MLKTLIFLPMPMPDLATTANQGENLRQRSISPVSRGRPSTYQNDRFAVAGEVEGNRLPRVGPLSNSSPRRGSYLEHGRPASSAYMERNHRAGSLQGSYFG